MEVQVDGHAKQFRLKASTKSDADALIGHLVQSLRETFHETADTWRFEMDITSLRKIPSIAKLRVLAKTLDELQPGLVQYLQHTTIVCNTRLQRLLVATIFKIHKPTTPIAIVMHAPNSSCASVNPRIQ